MKQSFLFLLAILFTLTVSSQIFKKNDLVEVEPLLSDSLVSGWKQASVVDFDSAGKKYTVKLSDGNKMTIPSKDPEKWIRPVVNKQVLNKNSPGTRIIYEKRTNTLKLFKCKPSEVYLKRNIRFQMASQYIDYPYIYVDFTSFKAQNGYDDKKYKGQFVYPYKIEMLVHLKRTLVMGGREYTEYQTWEFDRVYEYATRAGKSCEFYPVSTSDAKLVFSGWY
ncbi:MAG: hypothetical protein SGI83_17880 [Bacteroidota bacterium]|nr:hypothetical protein [Bacteroidota bacterium]